MSRRGWSLFRAVLLAISVVFLSPLSPLVLVAVPLAVCLAAFQPRNYVALALAGLLLAAGFSGFSDPPSPLWYAERAWALLLGGGFVLTTLMLAESGLVARATAAVGVAFGGVAFFAVLRPEVLAEVDWWVRTHLDRAGRAASEWLAGDRLDGMGPAVRAALGVLAVLYPAFLALASLASLGVCWYAVARLAGRGEALGPFREFRFSDHLVWVLIAGLLLFLLPAGKVAARLGENAMVFMGGLYLLRGIAILVWLGATLATSAWWALLWTAAALLLYPVVVGAAILLGLTDTWLDLRRRLRPPAGDVP